MGMQPRQSISRFRLSVGLAVLTGGSALRAASPVLEADHPAPTTAREWFNAGTAQLQSGKLREAEASLESALAAQSEKVQSPALYNLGHVRFGAGLEELKKGPSAASAQGRGRRALDRGEAAVRSIDGALASDDVPKMVAAYLEGRGARKELKTATTAVRRALETYGSALRKWQRASDDFNSAFELDNAATDARRNLQTVDEAIAKLVDSLRDMNHTCKGMCDKSDELGEKLKKLKGRIPGGDMPPGGGGDDEDDQEQPQGPQPGQQEGPTKDGQEMLLSPEQAGWLLDGFRLDSERRLPMTEGQPEKPSARKRPTW